MKTRVSLMLGLMAAVVGARTFHAAAPHKTPPRTDGSHVTADDVKKKGDDDGGTSGTGHLLAPAPIPPKKHDGKTDGKLAAAAPAPAKKKDDKKMSSDAASVLLTAAKKKPGLPKKADGYLVA